MSLTLHYNFLEDKSLAARKGPTLTCSRSGAIAKYRDSSGVVQTADANTGRFDHDASGTSLGLLVEEARTNIALHSNDWTNAVYNTVTNITPLKDATGPDGVANSASTLTATANGGVISQAITVASAAYTTSVWMRRKTGTGTVEITDNGFTNATNVTSAINSSTYTQVGKITRTQANPVVGIRLGTSGDEVEVAYLQCEAGSFATSPIETAAASVTRNADAVSAVISPGIPESASTLYAHFHTGAYTAPSIITLSDTGAGNFTGHQWIGSGTNTVQPRYYAPTNGIAQMTASQTMAANTEYRGVIGIATNDGQTAFNGVLEDNDLSITLGTNTWNKIHLGGPVWGAVTLNGHIAEIAYFNERLANATLEDYSLNGLPTAFPGTVAGDGGHIWPARSNDPRWAQIITDSGITPSGNFIDDVHAALEAMASTTGAMDDLWKKVKAVYSITDTSEPFTY